jgi:hypothetical protein
MSKAFYEKGERYRYFLIKGNPALAWLEQFQSDIDHFSAYAKKLMKKYGGNSKYVVDEDHVSAIHMEKQPNMKAWCQDDAGPGYYKPRRNTKAGAAIWKDFVEVRRPTNRDLGLIFLGSEVGFCPVKRKMYIAGLYEIASKFVISVGPSDDWKPKGGVVELKPTQFWRLVEKEEAADARDNG